MKKMTFENFNSFRRSVSFLYLLKISEKYGNGILGLTQLTFTCSNSRLETLEKGMNYVQS